MNPKKYEVLVRQISSFFARCSTQREKYYLWQNLLDSIEVKFAIKLADEKILVDYTSDQSALAIEHFIRATVTKAHILVCKKPATTAVDCILDEMLMIAENAAKNIDG